MHAPIITKSIRSPLSGCGTSLPQNTSRQATLTSDQSLTCAPQTSPDIRNAISSQASADGRSPSDLQAFPTTDLFGQALVHASHLVKPASDKRSKMIVICGQSGFGSSESAGLQSSLENRLRRRLGGAGSTPWP